MPTEKRCWTKARVILLPFICCSLLAAQDQSSLQPIRGPVLGFIVDKSAGIRPILGVPGAATIGDALLDAAGYSSVVFSPQRDYALALTGAEGRLVLLRSLTASLSAQALGTAPGAARVVTSPSGDAAAVYYAAARRLEVLTGLPDSPAVSWNLDLTDFAGGLGAYAVSDGGAAVLGASDGAPGGVFLLTQGAGYKFLLTVAGSPSLAFLANSLDAVVADGMSNRIFLVRDPKGTEQVTPVGGAAEGVSRPVAVAVSSDNSRVFVADAEPAAVVSLSLTGGDPAILPCSCSPSGLVRLAGDTTFRLSELGQGPLWVLDGGSATPRIVFVPDRGAPLRARTPRIPIPGQGGGAR